MSGPMMYRGVPEAGQPDVWLVDEREAGRALREQIAAHIEALVDYESADLPPGGTWISRTKVLALVRGGSTDFGEDDDPWSDLMTSETKRT
jgi:hypothetical protein